MAHEILGKKAELHAQVEAIALKNIHGDEDVLLACKVVILLSDLVCSTTQTSDGRTGKGSIRFVQ